MFQKIDYNSLKKRRKPLRLIGAIYVLFMSCINHDFIRYVSFKGSMGFVNRGTNMMIFKMFKTFKGN